MNENDVNMNKLPEPSGAFYAISVRNIDEAIAWYVKTLGFSLESQGGNEYRKGALLTEQKPSTISKQLLLHRLN